VLAHQTSEALSKKLARYAQLQSVAEALSKTTTPEAIAQLAVERTLTLIGKSDVCLLFLVDAPRQALSLVASKKREAALAVRAKHGDPFDRYVIRTHQPLLVADVRRDFRFTVPIAMERSVQSVIACPLLLDQRPEGVLRLDSARAGAYTQDDLRLLDVLADLVATAVINAKLFAQVQRMAVTDGLTGLSLRRPFLEQLTYELTRASRGGGAVSVLMLDLDNFKRYNDTWGHLAGDALLRSMGQLLRSAVPGGGLIARYGGDEFGVLLPRVGRERAQEIAETIRQRVPHQLHGRARGATQPMAPPAPGSSGAASQETPVTVSIGVASSPEDAQIGIELIRIADHHLYQAKRAGRNRVAA
jgi:diguanylate cyclase (GGDEF)-like protein